MRSRSPWSKSPPLSSSGPSTTEMRAFAYRLLGRREYSLVELENRIRQKWPEAEEIGDLVGQLAGENLVSDQRYAEAFTRSRVQRHQGPLKIRAAMRGKGVPDSIIAAAMEAEADDWLELARNWLQKQHPGQLSFKDKQKYYRRLVNRGFTHDQAMDACRE
jgi:regulatory protein